MKRATTFLLILLVAFSSLLCGCQSTNRVHPTSLEELDGLRLGLKVGSIVDQLAPDIFPNSELYYYNTNSDLIEAVSSGKIDYTILDEPVVDMACRDNPQLAKIDESIYDQPIGYFFNKDKHGEELCKEFNAFLKKRTADGTIDELKDKWLSESVSDYDALEKYDPVLTGENGTINYALSSSTPPSTYGDGDTYSGLEVEIMRLFCHDQGYSLNYEASDFSSILASVSSGKSDIGSCCITITEERKKSVRFSDPYNRLGLVPCVLKNINTDRAYPTSYAELDGLQAAAVVGMIDDQVIEANFPNSPIDYYNNVTDATRAVESGKADYLLGDDGNLFMWRIEALNVNPIIEHSLFDQDIAFVFNKGAKEKSKLYQEANRFIRDHSADGDGLLDEIKDKWFNQDNTDVSQIEEFNPVLTGKNGTITIGIDPSNPPFNFMNDDGVQGVDVEIAKRFADEYGYDIEWFKCDFAGLIPAVTAGKIDFAAGSIAITDERAKSVDFTEPYMILGFYPVVAKKVSSKWSIQGLKDSYNKTFIKEDRWKMVLDGLAITGKITLLSAIIGTILGFLIYLLYRKRIRPFNILIDVFSKLLSGLPIVVVLMIVYYIIFGKSSLSGTWISIIVFSISLMLSINSMLNTAVKSIDNGQIEGAISLGFTNRQTLFGIVLPQAMTQFIPNYMDELISLLHSTAIVGYIAVQDLTKISDVIRSRTYEAFFPLIATAVIYLLVVVLITLIIKSVAVRFRPQLRSDDKVLKQYK